MRPFKRGMAPNVSDYSWELFLEIEVSVPADAATGHTTDFREAITGCSPGG